MLRNTMNDRYMTNGEVVVACSTKDVAPFSKQGFRVCDKSEYDAYIAAPVKPTVKEKAPIKSKGKK